jgi:hypothetical protein
VRGEKNLKSPKTKIFLVVMVGFTLLKINFKSVNPTITTRNIGLRNQHGQAMHIS